MDNLVKTVKGFFQSATAADFQARASISLSVFKETIDNLSRLNEEALQHKQLHEGIIVESTNEVKSVEAVVNKNLRVIEKIKDIVS